MSANENDTINMIKSGKINLQELQKTLGASASAKVSVEDWEVCYSDGTGQLSEFCTVVSNDPNSPITGVGMIAYTGDGSSMLCVQYTNNFNDSSVATSIGTTLYKAHLGEQILCVVYGWTTSANYYFTKTISVAQCQ